MDIVHKRFRSQTQRVLLVITILLSLGVIGAVIVNWFRHHTGSRPNLIELTVPAQVKPLTIQIEASGKIEPVKSVNIGSEVLGKLVALYVDRGDKVKADQVIARVRTDEQEASLAQAKGQLAQAQAEYTKLRNGARIEEIERARAQVKSAQAQVKLSTQQLKRYRLLAREGAISQAELDEYIQKEQSAQASLEQAQQELQELTTGSRSEDIKQVGAKVAESLAKIKGVQAQLDAAVIRAPFSGIITDKYAEIGTIVTPSTTTSETSSSVNSSSIVELASGLEVLVNVPEINISRIQVGQPVKIIADSYPNRTFEGKVRQIDPKALIEDQVTSFQVRVKLLTGQSEMNSGMNVDAVFIGKSINDALMVPTVAITTRNHQMGVLVADKEGKARFRPVKVAVTQNGQTQILQGLREGERVFIDFPEDKAPGASDN